MPALALLSGRSEEISPISNWLAYWTFCSSLGARGYHSPIVEQIANVTRLLPVNLGASLANGLGIRPSAATWELTLHDQGTKRRTAKSEKRREANCNTSILTPCSGVP
jgi:hypothetical protein